jgi:hypothetical protein
MNCLYAEYTYYATVILLDKVLNPQSPHINDRIALRKTLTGSKANELRNLRSLAYKTRSKWEDRVKKVLLRLGEGQAGLYVGSFGSN